MSSHHPSILDGIHWWKVIWPVFFASGSLVLLSPRFEKIVKGLFHKWKLQKLIHGEYKSKEMEDSPSDQNKQQSEDSSSMRNVQITSIYLHPIKSLRPVSVSSAKLTNRGLEGDRCLMLVRPSYSSSSTCPYRFLTQRQCPKLATINASLPLQVGNRTMIEISNSDKTRKMMVDVSLENIMASGQTIQYSAGIWDDTVQVVDLGDEASSFVQSIIASSEEDDFSDVRLVAQVPKDHRKVDERYCPPAALDLLGRVPKVSLTDGFPILIASEESLQELNRRLIEKGKDPIPMSRFRPNIIVKGSFAFDEDEWKAIQIGGIHGPILHVVKGCPRCKQSCTDQITGERFEEPLETLKDFRALGMNPEDVYFAQNVVLQPGQEGKEISVGDSVRILTRGRPVWDMGAVQAE